jgi:hypothetical protein
MVVVDSVRAKIVNTLVVRLKDALKNCRYLTSFFGFRYNKKRI